MRLYHNAVVDFIEIYVADVIAVEKKLVSPKLKLGGTVDLYCKLQTGQHAVIDFKTSRSLQKEYALQTAAYSMLLYMNGHPVGKRWVVHLKKDKPGEYNVHAYDEDWRDTQAFLSALDLWYWKYGSSHRKRQGRSI
jgi:predicted RecB family nuclease